MTKTVERAEHWAERGGKRFKVRAHRAQANECYLPSLRETPHMRDVPPPARRRPEEEIRRDLARLLGAQLLEQQKRWKP